MIGTRQGGAHCAIAGAAMLMCLAERKGKNGNGTIITQEGNGLVVVTLAPYALHMCMYMFCIIYNVNAYIVYLYV